MRTTSGDGNAFNNEQNSFRGLNDKINNNSKEKR